MTEKTEAEITLRKDPNEGIIGNGSDFTDGPGAKVKGRRENFLRAFYRIPELCELLGIDEATFFCSNKDVPESYRERIVWKPFVDEQAKQKFIAEITQKIKHYPDDIAIARSLILRQRIEIRESYGHEPTAAEKYFVRFIAKKYFLNPGFGRKQKKQTSTFAQKGNPNFVGTGTHFSGSHLGLK